MPMAAGIHYSDEGEDRRSPPVLLVHGAGGTLHHWPRELRALPGHRVLAVDLPGHGKSPGGGRRSVADYARDVEGFMDAVGLGAAVVVGHSMGGAIGLTLALDRPGRVRGLGLVATGARLRVAQAILDATASASGFAAAVKILNGRAYGSRASPELLEQGAREMAKNRPEVVHGDFGACNAFDVMARIGEIRAPALVVCGTEDQMTPLRYSQFLRDGIRGAALATVEGAGHMVMIEQPVAVAEALASFLAGLPAPSEGAPGRGAGPGSPL